MLFYRKELDGLRAIAVIAVIIYHANLEVFGLKLFQGGFFGVDVFFVLSGYLITGIIRTQMEQKKFSFKDFYWRRAKRILPALAAMLIVTSGFAYLILLPDDLVTYSKSLISALYFGSNYFFYGEDSYTAAASIYRPLLHTWSLSVEWQFYVVYPVLIWIINRYFPRYLFGMLLIFALISFQMSIFYVKVNPDLAFYLLPTRAWELIFGGLVTFYNRSNIESSERGSLSAIIYQTLPVIGLCLILYSMLFFGHEVKHPSFTTLLPVLGTCLFIMFSQKGDISSDVMSLKPLVGIGLISYSLYLWHQPIFVFFRFIKHEHFRYEHFLLLLFISVVFSMLSYFFVEKTFRREKYSRLGGVLLITTLTLCFSLSFLTVSTKGFPSRLGNASAAFGDLSDNRWKLNETRCHSTDFYNRCMLDGKKRNIMLIGDSHAGTLGRHLYNLSLDNGWSYEQLTSNACTTIDTVTRFSTNESGSVYENKRCSEHSKLVSKYIEDPNTTRSTIIFLARLPFLLSGERFNNTIGGIEPGYAGWIISNEGKLPSTSITDKLSYWAKLGHEIVLVYPVPEVGWHVPQVVQKELSKYMLPSKKEEAYRRMKITTPYEVYKQRTEQAFISLDSVTGKSVIRVYPHEIFCYSGSCMAKNSQYLYYYDDDHLSTHGAKLLVNKISEHFL